ncbi:glucoamylase-like protein [Trypanosoma theileri]|uniref:Glucoamylase-like protein n=1 Tax=Trypanosoma theileri TaxID=67003 RepID=A0A1X0NUP6_9TRYP|nr:glucoamylase-like protein [Trypanosoma theileri]ORC87919.1 glucoamylase-like protein [Trypanosoma theileri]
MHRTVSPATVKTPHERYTDKQQHDTSVTSHYTAVLPSPIQNHQHYHYNHHQYQHQPQIQQNSPVMMMMMHNGPSTNSVIPLLPPHIHSMLYHSIVEPTAETVSLRGCGGKSGHTINSPVNTSGCLRTPTYTRQPPQHQHQQHIQHINNNNNNNNNNNPQVFASPSSVRVNVGCAVTDASIIGCDSGGVTTAEEMHLLKTSMVVPSPWSENTSVGNNTTISPSIMYRYPTTETKKGLFPSPVLFSPDPSPSKSNAVSPAKFSTKALERELFAADNDELVQILMELSSCNAEAAEFIQSKARLFSLRHTMTPVVKEQESSGGKSLSLSPVQPPSTTPAKLPRSITTTTTTTTTTTVVTHPKRPNGSMGIMERCCASANTTPSKPLAFEDETPLREDHTKGVSIVTATPANGPPYSHNSVQPLLLTPPNQYVPSTSIKEKPIPHHVDVSIMADANINAENRPFCKELHPCLHWYKSCRYAMNCSFVSLPRNLCLHWIRNSCVAGKHCSGVHRLPEPCPPDVQTVFALSHGADRIALGHVALQGGGQQQQQQEMQQEIKTIVEPLFQTREFPMTPKEQIISNPESIPASLEHYHHELHLNEEEEEEEEEDNNNNTTTTTTTTTFAGLSKQGTDDTSGVSCNCRSCRSVPSDELQPGKESTLIGSPQEKQQQQQREEEENLLFQPVVAQPICRSLSDSFAAAAATTTSAVMITPTACEPDEDGGGCPPRQALTRTHSPV